ncbi:MAG: (4Fe-4S)-binding protein [Eudoraea sp.]
MAEREIKKEYSNGDLTVVWKPQKCIHSGICVSTLPKVYDPEKKPWIEPEKASIDDLKLQIDKCPSAALSYYMKEEKKEQEVPENTIKIVLKENGPLLATGNIELTNVDGSKEMKSKVTAFCRCGASAKKPYCDGNHNKVGFIG